MEGCPVFKLLASAQNKLVLALAAVCLSPALCFLSAVLFLSFLRPPTVGPTVRPRYGSVRQTDRPPTVRPTVRPSESVRLV